MLQTKVIKAMECHQYWELKLSRLDIIFLGFLRHNVVEKHRSSMFLFFDIVLGYCKDFREGWYLDREGILINFVPRKNWHYPLYWQKPTSARPGHCAPHRCHLFLKNHQQQDFKLVYSSHIFLQIGHDPYDHLLDAEFNPSLVQIPSILSTHWLLAKWGSVPGDISGQLPYYF